MKFTMRRWSAALLAGVVALGAAASAARGQVRSPPVMTPPIVNPAFAMAASLQQERNLINSAVLGQTLQQVPPWVYGYNPATYAASAYPSMLGGYPATGSLTTSPYGSAAGMPTTTPSYGGYGGSSYGGNYYMDPTYGFLSGTADVINAQGNFYKNVQASRLTQTQADESRIDYRRKLIDEARYERGLLPTTGELRQQELARSLDWARHEPPISDVASALTLNALLHHLTSDPSVGKGPNVPIDEEVLHRINVTSPTKNGASLGLLKQDGGRLNWPQPLTGADFEGPRTDMTQHMGAAVSALSNSNPPTSGTITDLKGDLDKLRNLVEKSDMSPTDYIKTRGYLDQLASTIKALEDENVVPNFNNKFTAKNAAELVDYMKAKGLDFAPAAPGDESAYRVLQQALVSFDYGASGQATATPPAQPRQP